MILPNARRDGSLLEILEQRFPLATLVFAGLPSIAGTGMGGPDASCPPEVGAASHRSGFAFSEIDAYLWSMRIAYELPGDGRQAKSRPDPTYSARRAAWASRVWSLSTAIGSTAAAGRSFGSR